MTSDGRPCLSVEARDLSSEARILSKLLLEVAEAVSASMLWRILALVGLAVPSPVGVVSPLRSFLWMMLSAFFMMAVLDVGSMERKSTKSCLID